MKIIICPSEGLEGLRLGSLMYLIGKQLKTSMSTKSLRVKSNRIRLETCIALIAPVEIHTTRFQ